MSVVYGSPSSPSSPRVQFSSFGKEREPDSSIHRQYNQDDPSLRGGITHVDYYAENDQNQEDVNDVGKGRYDGKKLSNGVGGTPYKKKKQIPIAKWFIGEESEPREIMTSKIPMKWPPIFIIIVIIAEASLMIAALSVGGFDSFFNNNMLGPPMATLLQFGAKSTDLIRTKYQIWRLISAFVIHEGIIQIIFNLMWQLTTVVRIERQWGIFRVAPLYIISGIGGNLLSSVFLPGNVTIGASSCLCGMLTSLLAEILMNWKVVHAPWKSFFQVGLSLTIFFALGFIPGIDNFSHIGGAFVGFFLSIALAPRSVQAGKKHAPYWKTATFIRICAVVVVVAYFAVFFALLFTIETWSCGWCQYLSPTWDLIFGDSN
ncbi:hypothetical protein AKO1_014944 [Acrasis kona]|uniref:rhomboid protease n=1 Tax=Acrasis kona TaxID=1008807 RepID=A0AAW2Z2A6_9EUKA